MRRQAAAWLGATLARGSRHAEPVDVAKLLALTAAYFAAAKRGLALASERKRAETALTGAAEARFRGAFEGAPTGMAVMSLEGRFELGCRFALDDFGAGFGAFYYLKHLPLHFVKIDGELVRNCCHNQTDRLLIRAVVDIARGLEKRTIAEIVSDENTVRLLTSLGVNYAQGFHLGRPKPVAELAPTLMALA